MRDERCQRAFAEVMSENGQREMNDVHTFRYPGRRQEKVEKEENHVLQHRVLSVERFHSRHRVSWRVDKGLQEGRVLQGVEAHGSALWDASCETTTASCVLYFVC